MKAVYYWRVCSTLLLAMAGLTLPSDAQVVPDGTLSTTISQSGNNFTITNGNQVGNNLFHSFSQFSISTNGSAFFNNATTIQNIFARVTGGSASNIDGLIRANGTANLFLLNPAGILFGPNAKLNLGGSFVGTTAASIQFADGRAFGTTQTTGTPLLTMSVPVGLQMGQTPGAITVQNTGHRLTRGIITPVIQSNNPVGLAVQLGNTLALIGGEINLVGGVVTAPSGHIELGSTKAGTVAINTTASRWQFNYSKISQFADIRLSQQAFVSASGSPAGSLRLQGQNISVLEGSVALLENFGGTGLGNLVVNARETLAIRQEGVYGFANSQLISDNLGSGKGNNVMISAQRLDIQNGGEIAARTFGAGVGGNIDINVLGLATIDGWSSINPLLVSLIGVKTLGSARSGDITVSTNQLRATNGGVITNTPLGKAAAGDVTVYARDWIELIGENPLARIPSAISSIAFRQGNGGNLNVTTARLTLRDGGVVNATTTAAGNGGKVFVTALDRIEVIGMNSITGRQSRLASAANVSTINFFGTPPVLTGDAGGVTLNTPLLSVSDRGIVGVENEGSGNAGQLLINADRVMLDRQGIITASTKSGNGGNITLNLQAFLLLRHQSTITTTGGGSGNGGNIAISAPIVAGFENSDIVANAVKGRGGNINITTQGIFGLKYRPQLTPANDITASSQFGVSGTVQVNNIGVDPNSGLVKLPTNVVDTSQQIATGCTGMQGSSFIATGRGGVPQNPTQQMTDDRTWSDLRDLSAYRKADKTDAQRPAAVPVLLQAGSWQRRTDGTVELMAAQTPAIPSTFATCSGITANAIESSP